MFWLVQSVAATTEPGGRLRRKWQLWNGDPIRRLWRESVAWQLRRERRYAKLRPRLWTPPPAVPSQQVS